ncbi:MAG: DUF6323 family protein [Oscillospiraceae bacterium]|nr:DUF6323 family protein [Oscillospiraceae bacterium]
MDFSLSAIDFFSTLPAALQKNHILATNDTAFRTYGLQLTPDEAEMVVATAEQALKEENLIQFGDSIVPRLIHWFLPSGYLGSNYAARVAELTDTFYHISGQLQEIYTQHDEHDQILSDNAILNYMYQFYVSPSCAGDCEIMRSQMESIIVTGIRRLLEARKTRSRKKSCSGADAEYRALYSDMIQAEAEEDDYLAAFEDEQYDMMYRDAMSQDMFGNYVRDYDYDYAEHSRGRFDEELVEILRIHPELIIPSALQEKEWIGMVEDWESQDLAASKGAKG